MQIVLVRHGEAVEESVDPRRPLSEAGAAQAKFAADALRRLGVRPCLVISSRKARAVQTADTIASALGCPADARVQSDLFNPSASVESALEFLAAHSDKQTMLVAGHMPSLAQIAALLLSPAVRLDAGFDCGGMACIEAPRPRPGAGTLRWLVPNQALRLLAAQV